MLEQSDEFVDDHKILRHDSHRIANGNHFPHGWEVQNEPETGRLS